MQIVFVDIVAYSKRKSQKQLAVIDAFTKLLESTITETAKINSLYFQQNDINFREDIVILPTGDGVVLGFPFDTIFDLHLNFSVQLVKSIYKRNIKANCPLFDEQGWCDCHDSFNLRIGLSEGKLILYKDINDSYNIAGNAINMAARVMSFGGSNQILLAEEAYKQYIDITKKSNVETLFRVYPHVKIKHGLTIFMYQYIDPAVKGLNSSILRLVEFKNSLDNIDIHETQIDKLLEYLAKEADVHSLKVWGYSLNWASSLSAFFQKNPRHNIKVKLFVPNLDKIDALADDEFGTERKTVLQLRLKEWKKLKKDNQIKCLDIYYQNFIPNDLGVLVDEKIGFFGTYNWSLQNNGKIEHSRVEKSKRIRCELNRDDGMSSFLCQYHNQRLICRESDSKHESI